MERKDERTTGLLVCTEHVPREILLPAALRPHPPPFPVHPSPFLTSPRSPLEHGKPHVHMSNVGVRHGGVWYDMDPMHDQPQKMAAATVEKAASVLGEKYDDFSIFTVVGDLTAARGPGVREKIRRAIEQRKERCPPRKKRKAVTSDQSSSRIVTRSSRGRR